MYEEHTSTLPSISVSPPTRRRCPVVQRSTLYIEITYYIYIVIVCIIGNCNCFSILPPIYFKELRIKNAHIVHWNCNMYIIFSTLSFLLIYLIIITSNGISWTVFSVPPNTLYLDYCVVYVYMYLCS